MRFGVHLMCTDETIRPDELARAAEERGFESLFFAEQMHIPASRETPWHGGELPRHFYRALDPFVSLSLAAAATDRLRVGTGICLVIQRDPITLAKEVATLDLLSGGRLLFGVGGGWNREQMRNHGTDPRTRFRLLRERVLAMKAIWSSEPAEFHGELVDFDPIHLNPKPVQRPHPPLLVGGGGPTVLERVLEYGDGWFPNLKRLGDGELPRRMSELRRLADERGVDVPGVSIQWAPTDPRGLSELQDLGVERCVFGLPAAGRDEVLAELDALAGVTDGL